MTSDYIGPNRQFKNLAFSLTSMRRFWMILNRVTMRPDLSFELGNSFLNGISLEDGCGTAVEKEQHCAQPKGKEASSYSGKQQMLPCLGHIKLDVKYEQIT